MKKDLFDLLSLIKESINEIMDFNNIKNFDYKYYNTNNLIGEFKLDDKSEVKVYIQKLNKNNVQVPSVFDKNNEIINFIYTVNDLSTQSKTTSLQELTKILKTVFLIIKKYIESHSNINPIYTIHATSKIGMDITDNQKRELYKLILSKHLPKDYRISDAKFENHIPIIAFQKIISKNKKI
jgi:hypothetical protein